MFVLATSEELINDTSISLPLFSKNAGAQLGVSCINLTYIAVVVAVSLKIDKKDLCRACTLWLFLAQAPSEGFQAVLATLQLSGVVNMNRYFVLGSLNSTMIINKYLQDLASQVYRVLALLLVFMVYTSYRYPFAYQRIFKPAKRHQTFLLGFLFLCFCVLMGNALSWLPVYEDQKVLMIVARLLYYLVQIFNLTPIMLITVLYCLSLAAIVRYARIKARRGESIAAQQRQLISVVIYSTAPNLLLFPAFVGNISSIIIAHQPMDDETENPILGVLRVVSVANIYSYYVRVPVLTISTFLAFKPYRHVLFNLFTSRRRIIRVIGAPVRTQTICT